MATKITAAEMVKPFTVLVVDDEDYLLKFVSIKLKVSGFQVLNATDGLKALDIVRCGVIDLVVTDLIMPGLDGIELIRRIRGFSEVPIIVLTGYESEEKRAEALKAGADDFVTKPFDPDRLVARIEARKKLGTSMRHG